MLALGAVPHAGGETVRRAPCHHGGVALDSSRPVARAGLAGLLLAAAGCTAGDLPPADALRLPVGVGRVPGTDWLLVSGGNLDEAHSRGALWLLDLAPVLAALDDPAATSGACRTGDAPGDPLECDASALVAAERTVYVPTGAGNVAVDPGPSVQPARAYVPVRDPAGLVWMELDTRADPPRIDCGQGPDARCGADHLVDRTPGGSALAADPVNVALDLEFGFAFLPHLRDSTLTLLALRPAGPEVVDVESKFYRPDPQEELDLVGGFAVARRPCDPKAPPLASRDCTRPTLVTSHRVWPGFRNFSVAPGLAVLQPGSDRAVLGFDPELGSRRPYSGDLAYEPGSDGERLLMVHTTPPGISRIDTSLDETMRPRDAVMATLPLCRNPNMLELATPDAGAPLAFVSCFGDDEVAVIDLDRFEQVGRVPVAEGANELLWLPDAGVVLVVGTRAHSLSLIGADPSRAGFLREVARIGPS